jgi:prophage maintenance system killer protein
LARPKCNHPSPSVNTQQWQKQVADLRAEILRLQEKMEGLETTLKVQEYQLKQKQDRQDPIALDLTEHTFQRLDTNNGFFWISVEEAVPYLNGYSLQVKAAKITVRWKKQYDFDKYTETSFNEWNEWMESPQEKETLLTDWLGI